MEKKSAVSFQHGHYKMSLLVLACMGLFYCCSHRPDSADSSVILDGTLASIQYAKGFSITTYNGYELITVKDPWQGSEGLEMLYALAARREDIPVALLDRAEFILVPVHRVVCLSTTHIGLLELSGELHSIIGISGAQYICNDSIRKGISENRILDVGYDVALNYELLINMKPDLVFAYGVSGEMKGIADKLKELKIPVVFIAEYLEPDPLARAEWTIFLAAFYKREELAASRFQQIATQYIGLKEKAESAFLRPLVMTGLPWKDSWNIPGNQSVTARFIHDAGGRYVWENRNTRDNIPLSIEQVVVESANADYWINSGSANSLNDILLTDERLSVLPPCKKAQVFNNNARMGPWGGNDYWESGVVNPQLVLGDLIHILHPEILPDWQLSYYKKLE
jgi:iron complex transport system substrate-binding protein